MLLIVLIAQFITPMSIAGTAIALPQISTHLGAHTTALQWIINGFNLAFALSVLFWGTLSDRIGYRRTFTIGTALFSAGSLVSAISPSLLLIDIARIFAGIGAAAVLTGSSSLLSTAFSGSARDKAFALFGTVNGLGLALGPTFSGFLVDSLGWRGVFAVHGCILGAIALICLCTELLPKTSGSEKAPLLDLSLLKNREFLAMCLVPVAAAIGFVTLLTYLPSALSAITALSPGRAGVLMLAMTAPIVVAPLVIARTRLGTNTVIYASLAALILGNCGLLLLSEDRSVAIIIIPMMLLGCGFGLPLGLIDAHALSVVPPQRAGTAAGLLNFFRIGSEAIFVALYGALLSLLIPDSATAAGQPGHPDMYHHAFTMLITGIVVLVGALSCTIVLIRRRE
ncbi:MFS transporter [Corynebacterium sp. sy039]|nr:MFS transporter [Corynebacterium sp. sy039]